MTFANYGLTGHYRYNRLNTCCISEYAQRVVDASVKLISELNTDVELEGVVSGVTSGLSDYFPEQLASIDFSDGRSPTKSLFQLRR